MNTGIFPAGSGNNIFPFDVGGYVTANVTTFNKPITIGVTGITEGKISLATHKVGDAPLTIYSTDATFLGVEESILGMGYNAFGELPATHKFLMSLETNYQSAPGVFNCEWYVQFNNAAGTDSVRPFQTTVNIGTTVATNMYSADIHYFWDSDGNQMFSVRDGVPPTLWIEGTTVLAHDTNNVRFITQKNTTGTSVPLLWLDNANVVNISTSGYHIIPQDDVQFYAAALGVILRDRADANSYRIKVTNGVLGTEIA